MAFHPCTTPRSAQPREMASGKQGGIGSFFKKVTTTPSVATLSQLTVQIGGCSSKINRHSDRAIAGDRTIIKEWRFVQPDERIETSLNELNDYIMHVMPIDFTFPIYHNIGV